MNESSRTRLHLVRHGLVDKAWHGRLYGCLDVPLSAEGRRQAERAASRLAEGPGTLDRVVHSGLERARFGAERVAALQPGSVPLGTDPDLRELDRGDWAGLTAEELESRSPGALAAWYAAPATSRPPGGESLEDLAARVLPVLDRLSAAEPGGELALVAHGWVLRVAVLAALGLPHNRAGTLRIPPGSIQTLDWPTDGGASRAAPILVGLDLDRPRDPGRGWYAMPPRSIATS